MAAVSRGAYEHGGIVVGITPGTQKAQCNEFSTVRLPTGFGFARSQILAHSADGAILIEGGIGTQEEAGRMYWEKKPTVALVPSGGIAAQIAGKYLDKRELMVISPAYSAEESVHTLVQCIRKIQHNLD